MSSEDKYESVLASRYCKRSPLMDILSEKNKAVLWRQLWVWLAEAELELGLKQVTQEAIDEMKANLENLDWDHIRDEERKLKHDVMAHNHAFGKICPTAAGIIHLGATSCFVQDNADLIVIRDSVDHLLKRTATVLERMAKFATEHADTVTVGRTHYQTASLTTVGKRAIIWAQELFMAFKQLENFRAVMKFRGIKGATGTQDSFLTLFEGDEELVEKLDEMVTAKAGFDHKFYISGQTYSRQQDVQLIFALSAIGAASKKICTDVRVLQAMGEILEPFEKDQIGSSAMPYKKNPMKSERVCSIARKLIHAPQEALNILADQGLERTLDDSAGRRMLIPDTILATEALLTTMQNIFEGISVQTANVTKIVREELPFLALEKAMMWLTEEGVDRQEAHSVIRNTALAAKELQATQFVDMAHMLKDPFFDPVRERVMALVNSPISFTGRCVSQTHRFVSTELKPIFAKYVDTDASKASAWYASRYCFSTTQGKAGLGLAVSRRLSISMTFAAAEQCAYASCYCEENVYQLCLAAIGLSTDSDRPTLNKLEENDEKLAQFEVVFISNPRKTIPLFSQKASGERPFVIWDYHVILLEKLHDKVQVWDLDSTLPFPCTVEEYISKSIRTDLDLADQYKRFFRIIPARHYLEKFSSDRSHMKTADGTWMQPPPTWHPIYDETLGNNLAKFMEMNVNELEHISRVVYENNFLNEHNNQ